MDSAQIVIFVFVTKVIDNMGKGTHFFGQPVYGQLIKCLNKDKIVEMSRNHGGERCRWCSTLSDANARRSEKYFEDVYRDLYEDNKK